MIKDGLCFDDVLLEPGYSTIESRSKIDISVKMGEFIFSHPVIPANMKTVTGLEMAEVVTDSGGLAILHRFMSLDEQLKIVQYMLEDSNDKEKGMVNNFAISVGVQPLDRENLTRFVKLGIKIVCVDIAHGDSKQCVEMTSWIRKTFPNLFIIAGNVATGSGAQRLWEAGADAVKVGIGPGSLCTTRIETGNGVPQLTALMDVCEKRRLLKIGRECLAISFGAPVDIIKMPKIDHPMYIIADGGIKNAGDIVKALCFADMVMVGNLFAGSDEAPGDIINIDGRQYKEYVGSSTHKTNHIEGVAAMVPYKGSFAKIMTKLLEGLKSGCSYQGANNLIELKDNPVFIRITAAGLRESHPHDVHLK